MAKLGDMHIKLTVDTSELTEALEKAHVETFRLQIRQIVQEEVEAALQELPRRIRASQGVQQ